MKGQMGNLTGIGYGLMVLGIVLAIGAVVLTQFSEEASPDLVTSQKNETALSGALASQLTTHNITFGGTEFGRFVSATLDIDAVINATGVGKTNLTVSVNGNAYSGRYIADHTYTLTTTHLVNGKNNIGITIGNASEIVSSITSSTLNITYEKLGYEAGDTTDSVFDTIGDLVDWLPIIIIVIVVALILSLLGMGAMRQAQ